MAHKNHVSVFDVCEDRETVQDTGGIYIIFFRDPIDWEMAQVLFAVLELARICDSLQGRRVWKLPSSFLLNL